MILPASFDHLEESIVQFNTFFLPVKTGCPSAESVNETPDIQVKKVIIIPACSVPVCLHTFTLTLYLLFFQSTTLAILHRYHLLQKNKSLPIDLSNILGLLLFVLELLGNQAGRLFEKIVTEAELS